MKKLRYDVIVAGGGSAGCAAASVLCKAGLSVALLEAGPDYGPKAEGRWPKDLLDPRFDPDSHDWAITRNDLMGPSSLSFERRLWAGALPTTIARRSGASPGLRCLG